MAQIDFETLLRIEPRLKEVQESFSLGWHTSLIASTGFALGSGFSESREISLRVAISETMERAFFNRIAQSQFHRETFEFNLFPTTCGFACGFDSEKTRLRSISEALERWVWSKWIDEKCFIEEIKVDVKSISAAAQGFASSFTSLKFFLKKFEVKDPLSNRTLVFQVGIVVALSAEGGVFPGSRVCGWDDSPWEHALLEAWRHLKIAFSEKAKGKNGVFVSRICHFARHGDEALSQLQGHRQKSWPLPENLLHKPFFTEIEGVYLWRTLFRDYLGWDKGDCTRFVY